MFLVEELDGSEFACVLVDCFVDLAETAFPDFLFEIVVVRDVLALFYLDMLDSLCLRSLDLL